jgi:hypothetical protein
MATATILQLVQAIGGLTGLEQLEGAQPTTLQNGQPGWVSVRLSSAQIAALASQISATGPLAVATDTPSGAQNNYTVNGQMGPTIGFVDLTPGAACNITGVAAGFNGQIIIVTNLSAFNLTLNALNSGSLAANQFRMAADFILTQNNGKAFKYSTTIGKWVAM